MTKLQNNTEKTAENTKLCLTLMGLRLRELRREEGGGGKKRKDQVFPHPDRLQADESGEWGGRKNWRRRWRTRRRK